MFKQMIMPGLFCYSIPVTTVVANSVSSPQINFNNDSDFLLTEIRATKQTAAGSILLQLSTSAGELLSNVALDTDLFAGDNYPVRLPSQVKIPANTQLNVQLTNTTGGNLSTQIQLWGYKVDKQ